jgi:hypothetical protein
LKKRLWLLTDLTFWLMSLLYIRLCNGGIQRRP